jgi:hypothetical protein
VCAADCASSPSTPAPRGQPAPLLLARTHPHRRPLVRPDRLREAVALVADGTIPAERLISKVVALTQAPAAFEALEGGGDVMKILVDCTDDAQGVAV